MISQFAAGTEMMVLWTVRKPRGTDVDQMKRRTEHFQVEFNLGIYFGNSNKGMLYTVIGRA